MKLKKYEQIPGVCDQVLKLDGRNVTAYVTKSEALLYLFRYTDAAAACEQALSLNPTNELAQNLKLVLARAQDNLQRLYTCERKIHVSPNDVRTHIERAAIFYSLKRFEEALFAY